MGETLACLVADDPVGGFTHGIRPGENERTLCGLLPSTVFANQEFREAFDRPDVAWRVCPLCKAVEVAIKCDYCHTLAAPDDFVGQREHMLEHHPEVINQRQQEAARWDGWGND